MDLGLNGKVAIVTGGSEGIGKGAAMSMAREGAAVVICARRKDVLDQAAAEIKTTTKGKVLPVSADVNRPADIQRVIDSAVGSYGRIDILVNNAGKGAAGPFESVTDEAWMDDFNLKVWAAVRLTRLVIPHMRKVGGGRIINVTNLGAKAPGAGSSPTSVARAAGMALTKVLSKEFGKENILVNTVLIGAIKSGQNDRQWVAARQKNPQLSRDEFYNRMAVQRGCPLGRAGEEREAGDVIAFLASDRASYLSGCAINLDGGASAVV